MLKKLLLATTAIFTLFVAPAHAGPLVGGIGALIGGIAGSGLSIGGLALGIFSMGAQWLLSMMLAPDIEQKGVKTKIDTGGEKPPSFILGEYCTPGHLVYANVWDKSGYNIENACLVYVIQLSCKPVNALSNVVFANNQRVTINPGSNWNGFWEVNEYVKGGSGGGYFLVKFHDGNQNAANSWLMDKFGSDPDRPWKNDMIGVGCAYVVIQAWYSNRGIWTGLPDLRWVVQGASLYDPRKDSSVGGSGAQRWATPSTWTYTKNPKVIEYNTIRGIKQSGDHLWGGTAEAYRLPLEYWFAAMNACDENVSKAAGGSVKRFEIGCEINLDDKPIDIIAEINKSCNGYTTEFGGTYKTWVGGPGLPVGTITDNDFLITADMETNKFQSQQSTYNTAYGTYPEPNQQWSPKDGPRFQDDGALAEDGEELALDISLPFVSENNQVQRILRAAVKDSRRQVTHEGQLPPKAWVYEPFDCLAYQSGMFGYSGDGKDFIIASKDDLPNVNQRVLLREVDITDTGWLPEYEQPFDTAPLVIVTPGTLTVDVNVFADQVDTTTGKDKPAIRVEWTWGGPEIDVKRLKWELRYPLTTKVIDEGNINNPENGLAIVSSDTLRFGKGYEIRFQPIPYAIRESDWTAWKPVTCVIVAVPTPPSLTRISEVADDGTLIFFVDVDWTGVAQEATYEIRSVSGSETRYYPAQSVGARIPVVSNKTYTVAVRAIGADGTPGAWSSTTNITVTKKNTAPTTPAGLAANGGIQHTQLSWTKCPDKDYSETVIYRSTTNDFTTATEVGRKTGTRHVDDNLANATTYYYWIVHLDRSGNSSAKHPTSNTAGVSATTRLVGDPDTDPTAPGTPAAPTLAQTNRDVDGDGKVDIAIKVTWSAASGAKSYELEITQGSDVSYVQTKNRSYIFQAKSGMLYSVKVAGVSFNLTASAFSSATTFTPAKKSALPATPGGLTALAKANAVRIDWTGATEADFKWARIYRNTTNTPGTATAIGKTKADWFRDDAALVFDTTYYYWVAFIDTSDNEGSKSSVASVVYTGTTTAHLADGSVTDIKIGGQLSESKTRLVGDGNLIRNPAFRSGSADGWSLFGVATVVSRAAAAVANAPANFVYELPGNSAFSTIFVGNPVDKFEVSGGETFAARLYFAAAAVTGSGVIHLSARFENGAADGIYNFATFCVASLTTLDAGNAWVEVKGLVEVPDLVNGQPTSAMTMYVEKGSGFTGGKAYFAKPRVRRATDNDMLAANAVTSANILDGAVIAAKIADAAISTAKFAATVKPVEIFATQAAAGTATLNRVIFSIADAKLYKGNGTAWVSVVNAADMTGTLADAQIAAVAASKVTGQLTNAQIADVAAAKVSGQLTNSQIADLAAAKISGQVVASQIADAAITNAKFAAGIEPIEILGTLPTTGNFAGRMVFLTTDNKLYRHNGTSFIASIAATDMSGQIVGTQITDGAITTAKMTANSISGDRITAGTLDASKIVADSVTAGQIAAGAISAAELAAGAVTAGKIAAGTIVAADIAADTITGAKIAAGTITSSEILAGTITATEIAAATITGAKIAADTIVAGNIAANAITAAELAAGAVTAGKIAAGTIVAADIATGAITAGKIAAGTIVAADIAADTITAGQIAAGAVSASELAAGAVIAGKIAAGTITANEIAANTITGAKIAAGTITTDRLATLSLTAANAIIGNVDISNANIGTLQVDNINLASGSIVQIAEFSGPAGIACAAGVFTECGSITINHGTKSQGVIVMGTGVNGSGGTRTIDLRISNAGGAILSDILGVQVADNGQFSIPLSHVPIVASTTYRLLVKPAAAFTAAARRMVGFGAKA